MLHLENLCCICLHCNNNLKQLSEADKENITYFVKLTSSIPEMCFEELNEKNFICKECSLNLDTVHNFRNQCLQNKPRFIEFIIDLNIEDDDEMDCEKSIDTIESASDIIFYEHDYIVRAGTPELSDAQNGLHTDQSNHVVLMTSSDVLEVTQTVRAKEMEENKESAKTINIIIEDSLTNIMSKYDNNSTNQSEEAEGCNSLIVLTDSSEEDESEEIKSATSDTDVDVVVIDEDEEASASFFKNSQQSPYLDIMESTQDEIDSFLSQNHEEQSLLMPIVSKKTNRNKTYEKRKSKTIKRRKTRKKSETLRPKSRISLDITDLVKNGARVLQEKERRATLRAGFTKLKCLLPELEYKNPVSNVEILQQAAMKCKHLTNDSEALTRNINNMKKYQDMLKRKILELCKM